jgi:hypothetical protein
MCDIATSHYVEILGTSRPSEHALNLEAVQLPIVDLSALELPFSQAEISEVLRNLPPNKAPMPNGFSARLYQVCLPLIKDVVMKAIAWFDSADGWGLGRINDAYITLLPKHDVVVEVSDFIPISLIHSAAKIASKAMAVRLAKPLPLLVVCN